MTGNKIALDTSQAIAVLNDTAGAAAWISRFDAVYLPVVVLGELKYGALNSRRKQTNLQSIEALLARCVLLDITSVTSDLYAQTRLELKHTGRPIPENDVWIAAICRQHGLPIATADEHFGDVPGLQVVRC